MAVLAIAASSFAAAPAALAQEVGPDDVIIEAVYPTAIAGLEDLVFDVTRGSAPTEDLLVLVTLSPGILSAIEQTLPVLILANSTGTRLSVSTRIFIESAPTGDVTATVVDGDDYDVGDPSTATVRVFVGEGAVAAKVGFSAPGYTLNESVGTTTDQIRLTVRTNPGTPVPRHLTVPVWTRDGTAASVDDYSELSGTITFLPPWTIEETPDGDVYSAEESVRVSIVDDDESEGDERFTVWVGLPTESPDSVSLVTTDSAPECDSDGCGSYVTIVDNDDDTRSVELNRTSLIINESRHEVYTVVLGSQPTDDVTITAEVTDATGSDIAVTPYITFTPQNWNTQTVMLVSAKADDNRLHGSATITHTVTGADYGDNDVTAPSVQVSEIDTEGRTVVTLGMVPDGTVLPDVLAITVGETVEDGSTFVEGERALFRLLFTAADGGRAAYGANVELRFEWTHHSPTVPRSGEVSLIELSLPRVDVWDSAVRILDNDVGNPDGTLTMRITGCERHRLHHRHTIGDHRHHRRRRRRPCGCAPRFA